MFKGLLLSSFLWICAQAQLPPYIKPCSKSAADFKKCCVDHGNDAIPNLAKGDKKLGIPALTPLKLDSIDASPGPSLKIILKNVEVAGLDELKLTQVDINFDNLSVRLAGGIDNSLRITGTYEVDGKILVLPIKGNGPCNITGIGPSFTYDLKFKLGTTDGIEHLVLTEDGEKFIFDVKGAYFRLDNLFNGDAKLGDNVNNFMNENWKDVVKEVGGAISGVIQSVAKSISNSVFKKVPFKDLFLP